MQYTYSIVSTYVQYRYSYSLCLQGTYVSTYGNTYIIMHAVFVVSKAEFASDTVTYSNDLIQLSWARVTGLQTTAEIRQNALHNACPPPHTTYMFPLSILLLLPFILTSLLSPSLPSAGRLCESCSWIWRFSCLLPQSRTTPHQHTDHALFRRRDHVCILCSCSVCHWKGFTLHGWQEVIPSVSWLC